MARKKLELEDSSVITVPDGVTLDPAVFNDAGIAQELSSGTYYKVTRANALEAVLTEVTVKDGMIIQHAEQIDVARIILAKLMRKVGDNYGV